MPFPLANCRWSVPRSARRGAPRGLPPMSEWSLTVVTEPTDEPVTIEQVKDHLRIDIVDSDEEIDLMISEARAIAENYCRRSLATKTLCLTLDEFEPIIRLPSGPVQSIESIEYVDSDGATQTLAESVYRSDLAAEPARITPAWGESWPSTRCVTGAVTIEYVAGFTTLPTPIRRAILRLVLALYDQRHEAGATAFSIPRSAEALLAPYRSWL
jgi:uncharacterized phiE125 gp8 family phage protein